MQPQAFHLTSRLAFPLTQVEEEEGRTHLLIHLAIDEQNEHRWCLWRPDHERFDSRSIFESALIEKYAGIQKNALKSDKSGVEKVPTIQARKQRQSRWEAGVRHLRVAATSQA